MTDFRAMALDAAEIAMAPAPDVVEAIADTLAAFIVEERMSPHQYSALASLDMALRLLRERLIVEAKG